MTRHPLNVALALTLAGLVVTNSARAEFSTNAFTGGDIGEGLDLDGNFLYAIDFGERDGVSGGQTVRNATFTGWQATAGATNVGQNADEADPELGDTADDDALELVMRSGRWADADPPDITSDLTVSVGQDYKLQLLFMEGWNANVNAREFDIYVEDTLLMEDFNITEIAGEQDVVDGVGINTAGAVATYTFTATDGLLNIRLEHGSVDNPRLEALTLEVEGVPGDTNGDELVDLVDFATISDNFGLFPALLTDGDVAGGGTVDLLDFRLWKSNRTDLAGLASGGSIPEPAGIALAVLGVGGLIGAGRRLLGRLNDKAMQSGS